MSGAVQDGVIMPFLHRGYHVLSDWKVFHLEIERIQQILTNNNFRKKLIDSTIEKFLNEKIKSPE